MYSKFRKGALSVELRRQTDSGLVLWTMKFSEKDTEIEYSAWDELPEAVRAAVATAKPYCDNVDTMKSLERWSERCLK